MASVSFAPSEGDPASMCSLGKMPGTEAGWLPLASWQEKKSTRVRVRTDEFGAAHEISLRLPSAKLRSPLSDVAFNREQALKEHKSVVGGVVQP